MKYIIIPILKLLTVPVKIFLGVPFRWLFYLIFHFRILNVRQSFTFYGECILDFTISDWIEGLFSKEATDYFLNNEDE